MLKKIFSIVNTDDRKVITIFGVKFKIKHNDIEKLLILNNINSLLNLISQTSNSSSKEVKTLLEDIKKNGLDDNFNDIRGSLTKILDYLRSIDNKKHEPLIEKVAIKVHQLGKLPRVKDEEVDINNSENILKLSTLNEEPIIRDECPLCGGKLFLETKEYEINNMIKNWINEFNFLPISDCYKDKILKRRVCINCGLNYYNYYMPDTSEFYEEFCKIKNFYGKEKWDYDEGVRIVQEYKPKSVLDIGCGHGHFLDKIKHSASKIIGTEFNPGAVKVCHEKDLVVLSDNLNEIDSKFDLITIFQVLEHVTSPKNFIAECLNLVNDNGYLLIVCPNADSILNKYNPRCYELPPHHNLDISPKTYEYIAKEYDLEIVEYKQQEVEYWLYLHYLKGKYKFLLNSDDKWAYENFLKEKNSLLGQNHLVLYRKNKG